MIELFKNNQFFITLLMIPYTFLIRINSWINPKAYAVQEYDTPFAAYIFNEVIPSPIWQSLLACFLVFLTANFLNRLVIQNRMSKAQTLLPGLFYILITAGMPSGMILSPAMISVCFIVLSLLNLFRTYKNKESAVHIFNAGFYTGIATLIYPASLFLWFFCFIALLNLRSFKVSEIIISLSGLLVPFLLLGTYYYWNDEYGLIYNYFQLDKGIIGVFSQFSLETGLYLLSIAIIVVYTILRYNTYTMKTAIQVQKKVDIMYWLMLFSLLMLFFTNGISATHFTILAIPFAFFIGVSYEKIKNGMVAELLHVGIIVAVLFSQFQGIF